MSSTLDSTTLICLFHHDDQARAALEELQEEGIAASSITTIRANTADADTLAALGVPARDLEHLQTGLSEGGTLVAVRAEGEQVDVVESIFDDHHAGKIDEVNAGNEAYPLPVAAGATAATTGEVAIPIVEEELLVGKRTVDQGGVRVYRRVVEIPTEQSVNLREERVVVERNLVDRPATQADLAAQGARTIELTETAEEAVVSKNARVVEEVLVGKQTGERTEHITDTVRRTEVELEELPSVRTGSGQTF